MPRGRRKDLDAELAELGAAVRFAQLKKQMDDLIHRFPNLRGARQAWKAVRNVRKTVRRHRRRETMSAAARAAVSKRMRKYWAARRKAEK
jgi:hypothetical protein